YFERRFDRRVRVFGSCLFVVMNILWQPICIYVPALTLNQVSGISVSKIVPLTSFICILYTSLGGIKGVVWTDVIQGTVMIGSMLIVIIKGTLDLGGLSVLLDHNRQYDRLVGPDMTFDPTARMGVFALFVGGALFKLQANGINQTVVQRYLTLPNNKDVKKALVLSLIGFMFVMLMCVYIGMLAFAEFYHCDPITTGLARAKDQVIPLYVVKNVGHIPGLVGLFVAGVFSAALSSLSTALNSLSGVILTDFVEPFRKKPLSERQTAYLLRGVVISFGLISMASVPIVQRLGLVMQLSSTVAAITCGPLLGAFSVGMLLPFVKTESLLTGISCASSFTAYIVVRAQIAIFTGSLTFPAKPVSIEDCDYTFDLPENWNATITAYVLVPLCLIVLNLCLPEVFFFYTEPQVNLPVMAFMKSHFCGTPQLVLWVLYWDLCWPLSILDDKIREWWIRNLSVLFCGNSGMESTKVWPVKRKTISIFTSRKLSSNWSSLKRRRDKNYILL
ncbi:GM10281, partial [Drosophila sechellia]